MKIQRQSDKDSKKAGKLDRQLLFIILGLVLFGVVMVFDASAADAIRSFGDKFFFAKRQVIWSSLGIILLFIFANIDYKIWKKLSTPFFIITIILLVIVVLPGLGIAALGAHRRLDLGPVGIQPSELAKLSLVIFLSSVLSKKNPILYFLLPVGIIIGLVMLEPDLGTTSIIAAISLAIFFASNAPFLYFIGLVVLGGMGSLVLALTSHYRRDRVLAFLNPGNDPVNSSYHIRQILIALGSGGLFGVGLGQSRQKYLYLPEPATDSIFAIIGEELGFLGTVVILAVFLALIWKGFTIASNVQDPFGRFLAIGIITWLGAQIFVNLSAMVAFLPLTGIPLPFVSYGGSSLVVSLGAVGILLNISRYQEK